MTKQFTWWRDGVIYQIYPRSFADSNGDGIGDIPGITAKLDYLASLGISGIWLSPINRSPMYDFGYDVSDYRDIDPIFGTLDDFREFVKEAHARGIRIMMDMVMNHTSHLHPWFVESASSRENPKRDWYVWHDGRGKTTHHADGAAAGRRTKPPNNWLSIFGGKAWEWDETTRAYYLHSFVVQQPDLNWYNPEVRDAVETELKFWLNEGIDGFRFDVINWFGHDREFRSNPWKFAGRPRPYDLQRHIHDRNHPVSLEITQRFRSLLDRYDDRAMVCEVFNEPPGNPALSASYTGPDRSHMGFDFSIMYRRWNAKAWFDVIAEWDQVMKERSGWPCLALSNHDRPRTRSRLGSNSLAKARVAAVLHMTVRGTPFLYYGEELGMENRKIPRAQIVDPVGKRYWPLEPGRDPVRTPMQWDASEKGGFTTGTPWLPLHPNRDTVNVDAESRDPDSLLNLYRSLIRLRNESAALQRGSWTPICDGAAGVIAYVREIDSERKHIVLNFRKKRVTVSWPDSVGDTLASARVLLSTHRQSGESPGTDSITLDPFEATVFG